MHKTLYFSIVRMVVLLVSGTAIIMLLAVWDNLSATVHKNIYGTFENVAPTVQEEIANLSSIKSRQLTLLLQNTTRQNRLGLNKADIQISLKEILDEVESDLIFFRNEQMLVKVEANSELTFEEQVFDESTTFFNENNASYGFYFAHERLFWLINAEKNVLPNDTSLVIGFELNQARLKTLAEEVRLNMSLVLPHKTNDVISTLKDIAVTPDLLDDWILSSNHFDLFNLSVVLSLQPLYTAKVDINNGINVTPSIYLSLNAKRISANFVELLATIAGLSFIAIILAIILATYKARRITTPLVKITEYSELISQGHYPKDLTEKAHTIEFMRLISAFNAMRENIESREQQILHQSQTDTLSGLFNKSFMQTHIDELLTRKQVFQVIGINLNKFRDINDVFGYEYGDECLRVLAKRLKTLSGKAARLTGGEIVWLPRATINRQQLLEMREMWEADVLSKGISINISTSISVMTCPNDADNSSQLFNRLSMVLDLAKRSKEKIETYTMALETQFSRRRQIISKLKSALFNNSSSLYLEYQPQLNLQTGEVCHIEALARWHDSELGQISPDEFIQIAEDAGFIQQITHWVINNVMQDASKFKATYPNISIAINISAQDITSRDFVTTVLESFRHYALNADAISFELTESAIVRDSEQAKLNMQELRDVGCKIAIDDFGTGYSSLSYLTTLPVDILKIDRCFVQDLSTTKCNQWICRHIIELADDFNFSVVAEGIEDRASMRLLGKWGCHYGQGYYISKPLGIEGMLGWLGEQ